MENQETPVGIVPLKPENVQMRFNVFVADRSSYLKGMTGEDNTGPLLILNIIGSELYYTWDDIDLNGVYEGLPPAYTNEIKKNVPY